MQEQKGKIVALCISEARGTVKHAVPEVKLVKGYGIEGDAHAGHWHRQVSLLSAEQVDAFNQRIASSNAQILPAIPGTFGENILVSGIDLRKLPVGSLLIIKKANKELASNGNSNTPTLNAEIEEQKPTCDEQENAVILKLSQIGKECHSHCQIFQRVGDCIMPREGVFATVEQGGALTPDMEITAQLPAPDAPLRAAVITLSDKGSIGERVDTAGPRAADLLTQAGYDVVEQVLLPDVQAKIERELKRLADSRQVDLIITTGGTGMSPRDVTPEATMAVATRLVPGIAEAIRAGSLAITKRAMLSRGVSVLRNATLIVNLPGSKKAVEEALAMVLPTLEHGIRLAKGTDGECGRT
ncbi:MAG: molybdopterin-binding protein [Phascolarctobacterium sp.]